MLSVLDIKKKKWVRSGKTSCDGEGNFLLVVEINMPRIPDQLTK